MAPTIRLKGGASDRLKRVFGLPTDSAVARYIGFNQGQYSRIINGRSGPGPYFQARLLLAAETKNLTWYDLFEVVTDEGEEPR